MNPVITHNKTYEQRLQEYKDVLKNPGHEHLPASEIQKIWSSYIEFTVDCSGWLAIWKIPRLTCEQFKIEFPITVFVYVESVEFEKLSATVKVIAADGDINLPSKHFVVLLIELWPTKKQDKSSEINLSSTANCLDMLRVFYLYIFMPWDLDEDPSIDWVDEHLDLRLTLLYDMRTNKIPRNTAIHLKDLLTEARHLHVRQKQSVGDGYNQNHLSIRVRMIQIRNEVEFLENPLLRNALLQSQEQLSPKRKGNNPSYIVVMQQNKVDDYISFLNEVKLHVNQDYIIFKPSLSTALADAKTGDIIILSNSKHSFADLYALQDGGGLKGLFSRNDTVIVSTKEDNMLDCCGNITIENLTINVEAAQCGLLIRNGNVILNNCKVINTLNSHTCDGIIISHGASLVMMNCDISGFDRAIVANYASEVIIENSIIQNVTMGVTIYDNSSVKMKSCQFKNCSEFAIGVETNCDLEDCSSGDFEMLKLFPFVTIQDIIGEGNGVDCNINCIANIDFIQDLLSSQSDEECSNTMDTTVVNLK